MACARCGREGAREGDNQHLCLIATSGLTVGTSLPGAGAITCGTPARKPFDLEAARRGEPIIVDGENEPITFVGTLRNGEIVYESATGRIGWTRPERVFMAPRKVVRWAWHRPKDGAVTGCLHVSEPIARSSATDTVGFVLARIEWEE